MQWVIIFHVMDIATLILPTNLHDFPSFYTIFQFRFGRFEVATSVTKGGRFTCNVSNFVPIDIGLIFLINSRFAEHISSIFEENSYLKL